MDKLDKVKKKAMIVAWANKNKQDAQASFPLEDAVLNIFFTQIETLMEESGCFHDTRHAQKL